jgi:hypothetical protein
LKTGKIQIYNKTRIANILNRTNYLIYVVVAIFILIDLDLFSTQPKVLVTEGFFWKIIAVTFQLIFLASLIQWDFKKKKIIDILSNGILINGDLQYSEKIKPNRESSFYVHVFKYNVSGITYEVSFSNKRNSVSSRAIIYQFDDPKKAIVFKSLKKNCNN